MCRWENCTALGASRTNIRGHVPLADAVWFLFRLQADGLDEAVPVTRLQKRLLHLVAQQLEKGFVSGNIHLRDTPPRPQEEGDASTPWSTGSAVRNANLARQELLKRFLGRGSGFISGLRNSSNKEICPVQLKGTKGRNLGSVAADQFVTAYMVNASQALLKKMSLQKYKHMAWYEDASKVGTHEAVGFLSVSGSGRDGLGFRFRAQGSGLQALFLFYRQT